MNESKPLPWSRCGSLAMPARAAARPTARPSGRVVENKHSIEIGARSALSVNAEECSTRGKEEEEEEEWDIQRCRRVGRVRVPSYLSHLLGELRPRVNLWLSGRGGVGRGPHVTSGRKWRMREAQTGRGAEPRAWTAGGGEAWAARPALGLGLREWLPQVVRGRQSAKRRSGMRTCVVALETVYVSFVRS